MVKKNVWKLAIWAVAGLLMLFVNNTIQFLSNLGVNFPPGWGGVAVLAVGFLLFYYNEPIARALATGGA